MIDCLKEISEKLHGKSIPDLGKIVRQKSSSYKKLTISALENRECLSELEEKGLIYILDEKEVIMLPLGYSFIQSGHSDLNVNNYFENLKKINDELSKQITDPLQKDNFQSIDCALGLFILIGGNISQGEAFPFRKNDTTWEFFLFIQHTINYLLFRINYNNDLNVKFVKDEVHFRNILGRNNKSGSLIKRTKLHRMVHNRGLGTIYHWFEIQNIKKDTEEIFDRLIQDYNNNILSLLNIKKILLDSQLINALPFELKKIMGDRPGRLPVINVLINNVSLAISKFQRDEVETAIVEQLVDSINQINLQLSDGYNEIANTYNNISELIRTMPNIGIFLIELHYRLAKIMYQYEYIDKDKEKKLIHYQQELGEDFNNLLEDSKKSSIEYLR